jgi:hypothetical protein
MKKEKYTTIDNNTKLKGHNGFKMVNVNDQEKIKTSNPLTSVFKLNKKDSPLAVKGQIAPRPKQELADGHLAHGSEPKHKETPHFPLRRSDDDVE